MTKFKTIRVTEQTYIRLIKDRPYSETMDSIISGLLDKEEKIKPNQ